MKMPSLLALTAASFLALSAGAASAQAWMSINERQAALEGRIDAGVRSGQLTRDEAARVRAEFRDVASLEARYRADGLTPWERSDLDRRFDSLSARVRFERRDADQRAGGPGPGPGGGRVDAGPRPGDRWDGDPNWRDDRGAWMSINQRQAQLEQRIDQGVRSGRLTQTEAQRLRAEFRDLARLERRYRAGGLSRTERADLDRRFDRLAARIRWQRHDGDRAGYGSR